MIMVWMMRGTNPGRRMTMSETRGGVSDEAVKAATGRTPAEWEAVLDARGAADLPHGKIVALLRESGEIESSWWMQQVANGYEKRKGKRVLGQTEGTGFQIGVRRTLSIPPDEAWRLVTSAEGVRGWLGGAPELRWEKGESYRLRDGSAGEVRVFKPGSHLRITWQPEGWPRASTIQVRVMPSGEQKSVISFHQEHLPGPAERQARREFFDAALDALEEQAKKA